MLREVGDKLMLALALMELAIASACTADANGSLGALGESLALLHEIDSKVGVAQWLETCARVAARQNNPSLAATLYGAARTLRASLDASLDVSLDASVGTSVGASVGAAG